MKSRIAEDSIARLAILSHMKDGRERSGQEWRKIMEPSKAFNSLPAFYSFMHRLEREGLIVGRYVNSVRGDVAIRERYYCLAPAGLKRLAAMIDYVKRFL